MGWAQVFLILSEKKHKSSQWLIFSRSCELNLHGLDKTLTKIKDLMDLQVWTFDKKLNKKIINKSEISSPWYVCKGGIMHVCTVTDRILILCIVECYCI